MAEMIAPMADKILVKRADPPDTTAGGLFIPENFKETTCYGVVVAVGPGKINARGTREPMSVKVGEKVYFAKNAVVEVQHNGSEHILMKEERVFLIENK
jgi:chaperonin GroES